MSDEKREYGHKNMGPDVTEKSGLGTKVAAAAAGGLAALAVPVPVLDAVIGAGVGHFTEKALTSKKVATPKDNGGPV